MKIWKKIVVLFMCLTTVLYSNYIPVNAMPENVAIQALEAYKDALLDGDLNEYQRILKENESTSIFNSFMKWRILLMDILDVNYSTYEYDIIETTYEGKTVKIVFNEIHEYENGAGIGTSYEQIMNIKIDSNNRNIIEQISLENDEFYDYFISTINEPMLLGQTEDISSFGDKTEILKDELILLKEEMDRTAENQVARDKSNELALLSTTYSYSGYIGASYANKYYASANPYFYKANLDCTNFVSQCIWAAYGGWNTSMSDSTMQSNIKNKTRMTSKWYAGSGGGSIHWENVEELWNYAVGNTGTGPKAIGYNNKGYYTGILPIDIAVGDVLQRSYDGSSYGHSMYVVSIPGGSNPTYNEIIIAQHSSGVRKTVAEAIVTGKYLRQMQFQASSF